MIARACVCERERNREGGSMCRNHKCQCVVSEFHDRSVACHNGKCII